jgi:hypothetical protein
MTELRLGDEVDDHCIKCRRLTNHSVVSLLDGEIAKVRCRSCYHEHSYLHEQAPPSKKDLKKMELENEAAAKAAEEAKSEPDDAADEMSVEAAEEPVESKSGQKPRAKAKKN